MWAECPAPRQQDSWERLRPQLETPRCPTLLPSWTLGPFSLTHVTPYLLHGYFACPSSAETMPTSGVPDVQGGVCPGEEGRMQLVGCAVENSLPAVSRCLGGASLCRVRTPSLPSPLISSTRTPWWTSSSAWPVRCGICVSQVRDPSEQRLLDRLQWVWLSVMVWSKKK